MRLPSLLGAACALIAVSMLVGCGDSSSNHLPARGGKTVTIAVTNDGVAENATYVAFQDGPTGAWQRLTPSTTGSYSHTVTDASKKYGVIIVPASGTMTIIQATTDELTEIPFTTTTPDGSPCILSGTLTHLADSNWAMAWASCGPSSAATNNALASTQTPYSTPAHDGTHDFVAYTTDAAGNVLQEYLVRDLQVSGNATHDYDFTNAITFSASHPVTITTAAPRKTAPSACSRRTARCVHPESSPPGAGPIANSRPIWCARRIAMSVM